MSGFEARQRGSSHLGVSCAVHNLAPNSSDSQDEEALRDGRVLLSYRLFGGLSYIDRR